MNQDHAQEADRMLSRLEMRFGPDPKLRTRLRPIIVRVLESGPPSTERTGMLRLIVNAYAHHMKVRLVLDELRGRLRDRMNAVYGEMLGIEPPGLAA
ncbi:MAG: hypothetical protein HC813_01240 [Planctomycetes bacterium]|nr:hypothetical protein [Planctomycetota bacterium]